jgi:hypothetical protein
MGWRRRTLFISTGAVLGTIVGHVAFTQSTQFADYSADSNKPTFITESHTSSGGLAAFALLGAGIGYLTARDQAAWQAVAIPHCVNPS